MNASPRYPKPEALLAVPFDGHAFIEGAAGTGKTHAVEHLVVDAVVAHGRSMREVLVVTATEAEARRLVRAVENRLAELLDLTETTTKLSKEQCWVLDDPARRRIEGALAELDAAFIGTFHAFCRLALAECPLESGLPLELERIGEREAFSLAFQEVTRKRLAVEPELASLKAAWLELEGDGISELEELLYRAWRLGASFEPRLQTTSVPLAQAVVQSLLPPVTEGLAALARDSGLVSERDLPRLVDEALDGPGGGELARRLRRRYRAVLVDDFQEIDEVAWRILERLFFEGAAEHPLRLAGDPRQSTGAGVYLRARERIAARGKVVSLVESVRATPDLVRALGLLFDPEADPPLLDAVETAALRLGVGRPELRLVREDGASCSPVVLVRAPESESKEALLRYVAAEIDRLLRRPGHRLLAGEAGRERPLRASDVVVLTGTRAEAEEAGEALRRRGVLSGPCSREGWFQSREAEHVRDLLAGLAEPGRRTARLRAWLTPFFAVPLEKLAELDDVPPGHPLMKRLSDWSALARSRDYERLFDRVLEESGVVRRALFSGTGERAGANTRRLFELLLGDHELVRLSPLELAGELDHFVAGRGSPGGGAGAPGGLGEDSVRIVTLRESKELEATVAFLCAFERERARFVHAFHRDGVRRGYSGRVSRAPEDVRQAIERELRREDQRLVYRGLTRVRARLYLPLLSPYCPAATGLHTGLNRRLIALENRFQVEVAPAAPAAERSAVLPRSWSPPRELVELPDTRRAFEGLRERHRGPALVSCTPRNGSRLEALVREALASVELSAVASSGSLETWREREDVSRLFAKLLVSHGVERGDLPLAQELVYRGLTTELRLGGRRLERGVLGATRCLRDVAVLYPRRATERDGGLAESAIDLVFEHEGLTYACEWKADAIGDTSASSARAEVERRHASQARRDALALVQMLGVETEENYLAGVGGVVFCFLRALPGGVHFERPGWESILSSR